MDSRRIGMAVSSLEPARPTSRARIVSDATPVLQEQLPEYMIPSSIVMLGQLPRNRSGKIDRRLLPAPGHVHAESRGIPAPPGSQMESLIAGVWRDVLDLEQLGVHDNFFDLGGDSC